MHNALEYNSPFIFGVLVLVGVHSAYLLLVTLYAAVLRFEDEKV